MAELDFEATVIEWRGPSPYYYAPIPARHVDAIQRASRLVTYGWGMIPVACRIGEVDFTTSLFPKDGGYLLPLKDAVRRRCAITAGDTIAVSLEIRPGRR